MKYMGSKRTMLLNGLGTTIGHEIENCERFFDLFSGSGTVSWHVATNFPTKVIACDLQEYSRILARAVLRRKKTLRDLTPIMNWVESARELAKVHRTQSEARNIERRLNLSSIARLTTMARELCLEADCGPVQNAYGGYYFGPYQSLLIDSLRASLPEEESIRDVALAALIQTSSRCSASPGHTAQPFKPNETAGPYLIEAWKRNPLEMVVQSAGAISKLSAKRLGNAYVMDALDCAKKLKEGDIAFVDPPYSGVHYSRFYHVLETVAQGRHVNVAGEGRYPPPAERPRSAFSVSSEAKRDLKILLERISAAGARAIITFPAGDASNGLSGEMVQLLAEDSFTIEARKVSSQFSTLGGNLIHRAARQTKGELILSLSPR